MGIEPNMLNRVIKLFNINKYAYLVIISALLFLLILWKVPQFQVSHFNTSVNDPIKIAELEDKFRSTIAQILGGIAILVGVWLTYKNWETSKQGQITERFTRAIEHLGKDGLEFKLGGIYALERIANESEKDHWSTMEILTAYIRKHSPNDESKEAKELRQAYPELSIDTQAVLDVFKRRNRKNEYTEVRTFNLNQTYLRRADLTGAFLVNAKLIGTNLTTARLTGADLTGAFLFEAELIRANLAHAKLIGANLTGADLPDANLTHANLTHAKLIRADLTHANLTHANLSEADLTKANLSEADLTKANLSKAKLSAITYDENTNFDGVIWGENKPDFIKDKDK